MFCDPCTVLQWAFVVPMLGTIWVILVLVLGTGLHLIRRMWKDMFNG